MGIGLGDSVDGGSSFELCKDHQDLDDQIPVGGRSVKGLLGGDKLHLVLLELLKNFHEIRKGTADPIQLVDNHLADLSLAD